MNTGSSRKNIIVHKITQRRILMILFAVIFIIASISIILSLMNIDENNADDDAKNRVKKSDGVLSDSLPNYNSSKIISISSTDTNNSDDVKPEISNKESGKTVSSYDNESKNGEYLPLIIEQAKTKEVITATIDYFKQQLPSLRQTLGKSDFYYSEKLLDPNTSTTAFILALNENYAQNLNGYFYYLIDEKGSATIVSPFVLNISILFDEENRKSVVDSGEYAESKHLSALENSLSAALGKYYSDEVFDFILSEYRRTFKARIDGEPLQNPVVKFKISKLEVIFHNSFLTYVEFFIE